jgi:mRNA-degrading endonuclease RelE of RelBE toxin-antitoxin system
LAYQVNHSSPGSVAELDPVVRQYVDLLAIQPRPVGAKMVGEAGRFELWRLRIGDVRILYRIDERAKTVTIVGITDRRDPYSF